MWLWRPSGLTLLFFAVKFWGPLIRYQWVLLLKLTLILCIPAPLHGCFMKRNVYISLMQLNFENVSKIVVCVKMISLPNLTSTFWRWCIKIATFTEKDLVAVSTTDCSHINSFTQKCFSSYPSESTMNWSCSANADTTAQPCLRTTAHLETTLWFRSLSIIFSCIFRVGLVRSKNLQHFLSGIKLAVKKVKAYTKESFLNVLLFSVH